MSAGAQTTSSPIPGVVPTTDEHKAICFTPSTQVRHTGTDIITYHGTDPNVNDSYVEDQSLQIKTWDDADGVHVAWQFYDDAAGVNVLLPQPHQAYWRVGQALPTIKTTNPIAKDADPDIVLAYDQASGDLFANLVYLNNDKVQYAIYHWNPSQRDFDPNPVTYTLGDPRYNHSYPNIDANSNGLIAVTWQQTVTTQAIVAVTSVSGLFPSYSFEQTITFGRTVLAAGDMTGNFQPCYIDQKTGTTGVYAVNPPEGLFEQTLHPDVAISEGEANEAIVSSTFVRHYVDGQGLFSIINELAVLQFPYTGGCRDAEEPNGHIVQLSPMYKKYWPYSYSGVVGSPRIAAPGFLPAAGRLADVEVAIDRTEPNCGPWQYAVWNFGKSNGQFRDEYTLVSPLGDPNLIKAVEPAIAFSAVIPNRVPGQTGSTYTITFTGGEGFKDGSADDVWGVSLDKGVYPANGTNGPSAQPDEYGRINYQGDGNQFAPSVAGRHMTGNILAKTMLMLNEKYRIVPSGQPVAHVFFDEARKQVSFRRTGEGPYAPYYRPAPSPTGSTLQAYPNPSDETVRLTIALQPHETVRQLGVYDAMGRLVTDLSAKVSGEGTAEWTPGPAVRGGIYTVRVVTSQRTANTTLIRK